jgi:hypothetical protein
MKENNKKMIEYLERLKKTDMTPFPLVETVSVEMNNIDLNTNLS